MKTLRECSTIQEATPLIKDKPETFRAIVETAFALKSHPSPTQQAIGENFLSKAIREMDDVEQPASKHDDGVKAKGEKFVKEELLPGGNQSGNAGSEQSSGAKPTDEGTEEPIGDMEKPAMSTESQMKEGFMPPQMPGLDPAIAQQMAPAQQMPPMNLPQQVQQMQYTVREYVKPMVKEIAELRKHIGFQNEAIKSLNTKVTETVSLKNGLDLNGFKERQILPRTQETLPSTVSNLDPKNPKIFEKAYNLENARHKISELDAVISSTTQPYQ